MLPIIIVTNSLHQTNSYIDNLIESYKIRPHFIFRLSPDKKEIGINQIRLINKITTTDQKERRLFLIYEFHTASIEAQNAFLKTLEEKNRLNLFVMVTEQLGAILPTVISRARVVELFDRSDQASYSTGLLEQIMSAKKYSFFSDERFLVSDAEKAKKLIEQLIFELKFIRSSKKYPSIARCLLTSYHLLKNNNTNPQLTIDKLLVYIHRLS